jgi:hypothetical protein
MPLAVDELAEAGWCPLQGVALRVADLVIGRHADAADELPGGQRKSTWGREVTALVLLVAKVGASRHCETPIWRRRYETRRPALTAAGILFTASRLIALELRTAAARTGRLFWGKPTGPAVHQCARALVGVTGLSDMPDILRSELRRSPWTTTNPV